ncbi:hypothetical protein EAS54_18620 [Bradyrhizobium guangzhouense]|nr:hypothetical protein EAS54_18620 [Bradyrhizobium guangzhouense]
MRWRARWLRSLMRRYQFVAKPVKGRFLNQIAATIAWLRPSGDGFRKRSTHPTNLLKANAR